MKRCSKININWIIEEKDIYHIREFVKSQSNKLFVKNRIEKNLGDRNPCFSKDIFWKTMISCLLTTQQRSGPASTVNRFICSDPFPLNLNKCMTQANLNEFVEDTISNFGGLRFGKKIGRHVLYNLEWLENNGWQEIIEIGECLLNNRKQRPQFDDKNVDVEKKAAKIAIDNLKGFGPKQSRNLWQELGLTRFEIPIDTRITKWFNNNGFPVILSAGALSDENYYNFVMYGIQKVCRASEVFPCVLDAAIFASFDQE